MTDTDPKMELQSENNIAASAFVMLGVERSVRIFLTLVKSKSLKLSSDFYLFVIYTNWG